jgi:FtsH-binding integral membrane protein
MSIWGTQAVYDGGVMAADAAVDERVAFIRRTYAHLLMAVLAFVGLESVLFQTGVAERLFEFAYGTQYGYLIVIGLYMVVGYFADRMAHSGASEAAQYAALAVFIAAESVVFGPLLFMAAVYSDPQVIPAAAITTLTIFGGFSLVVLLTKKDFSFLGPALAIASFAALAFILCSLVFGLGGLGVLIPVGMVVLMCGYILYYTSQVIHHYRTDQHVSASLALFATIATLFWYVLILFMRRD